MVADFCLGFLGEVADFDFSLLLDLPQLLLDLLDLGLVLGHLLLELLALEVLLPLDLLDLDVEVLLLL